MKKSILDQAKNAMVMAWAIARKAQRKHGGKVAEFFRESLRQAWALVRADLQGIVYAQYYNEQNQKVVELCDTIQVACDNIREARKTDCTVTMAFNGFLTRGLDVDLKAHDPKLAVNSKATIGYNCEFEFKSGLGWSIWIENVNESASFVSDTFTGLLMKLKEHNRIEGVLTLFTGKRETWSRINLGNRVQQ